MTDNDSRGAFNVRIVRNARIPTPDPEVTLAADLYLPNTTVAVPAVVTIMHNAKDGIAGIGGAPYLRYFAEHGYASVIVDRQGTGASGGEERPPFDPGDADDGVTAVEWSARQPWCDGKVGMWGMSYGAIYTLRTAARRPTALKAIAPIMGMLDPERDMVHPSGIRGGMSFFGLAAVWNIFIQLMPPVSPDGTFSVDAEWKQRVADFGPWVLEGSRLRPGHREWQARTIDAGRIHAPALCVAGWHDVFLDGMLRAYERIPGPKRLVVGPWMHELPNESPLEPMDCIALIRAWWDRWLRDESDGQWPRQRDVVFMRGANAHWHEYEQWPPPEQERITFAATADHGLILHGDDVAAESAELATVSHKLDPTVGALSGLGSVPMAGFGFPLNQNDDDLRSLIFTSDPLTEPLVIAGRPAATLVLDLDATTAARCVVKLTDVEENGRSTLITSGVCDLAKARTEPDTRLATLTVNLAPTAYALGEGHRLRLVLADSDVPRLWPPPGPGSLGVVGVANLARPHGEGKRRLPVVGTQVTMHRSGPGGQVDVPRPAQSVSGPLLLGNAGTPLWTTARNHATGELSLTVGHVGFKAYTSEDRDQRVERDVAVEFVVSAGNPAASRLSSTGSLTIATTSHSVTVTAQTEVTDESMVARGTVVLDGEAIVVREWNSEVLGPLGQAAG